MRYTPFEMVMYVVMAIAVFVAMGLMRATLRQARRREYDGIRWRGIQWQKPPADDEPPPES